MTFEDSMKKVEEIISKLESNEISLEDSIQIYKEGLTLIGSCKKQLEEAEMLVTVDDSEN
ncbi:MAG: exodeoxyribonuclease VII small subunit [Ruminococcus sp.]|nr:exodeoxyribonuclease VII small subunit [Ruminococcus sp.]